MLTSILTDYILAAFGGIWIETFEPNEAEREIATLCQTNKWELTVWDLARGTIDNGQPSKGQDDPLHPLKVTRTWSQNGGWPPSHLVLLHNYHLFLGNAKVMQALFNATVEGKSERRTYIIFSPSARMPAEIEKVFTVLQHSLPDTETLSFIAHDLENKTKEQTDNAPVRAASGLTRSEAENAFALSIVRQGSIKADEVYKLKAEQLRKAGLLTLCRTSDNFSNLGGLQSLKDFCKRATRPGKVKPRGVLLLGVSGTGKSAFAKALGNEIGRPVLFADPGRWLGSLVGDSQTKIRQALASADAQAPCILFLDEVEKALAGGSGGYNGDGGVAADQLGTLLTWLNDHESEVFVIATSNDISKLPPEFTRAERWDAVWFLDLPSKQERMQIWELYSFAFTISDPHFPDTDNWTGAEIKSCCRLAALLDCSLSEAAQLIVPVANTAPEKVQALREWASKRCLDASKGGLFHHQAKNGTKRRSVT